MPRLRSIAVAAGFQPWALWAPAAAAEAPAVPAQVRELDVHVAGRAGETRLQVTAGVGFETAGTSAAVEFKLGAQHLLRGVRDEAGQPLGYSRSGDSVLVHAPVASAASRRWSFEYALSLFRRVEDLDAVFSHTTWLPSGPAGAGGEAPSQARIVVELPARMVALVPGDAQVEETSAGRRFSFRGRAVSHPLVIGRYAWRERRGDGLVARVLLPEALADRADALVDLLLGAATFFSAEFGSAGRNDFALAALPLGPGQHGVTFPGLVVLSAADVADPLAFSPRILAHEVAHHWWSLGVRFPEKGDAWLAEGLPTYAALLFLEQRLGAARLREELRNSRETALRNRDAPPLRVGAAMQGGARYTQTYHKAACVLHALRRTIGREAYLGLSRDLYAEFAGGELHTEQFARAATARAGRDLSGFFQGWLEATGAPRYEVVWREAAVGASGEPGAARRVSGVITRRGAAVEVPVRLRVRHPGGAATELDVTVASPSTAFEIACPAPALELEFDPDAELLHAGVRVRRQGG